MRGDDRFVTGDRPVVGSGSEIQIAKGGALIDGGSTPGNPSLVLASRLTVFALRPVYVTELEVEPRPRYDGQSALKSPDRVVVTSERGQRLARALLSSRAIGAERGGSPIVVERWR